MDRFQVYMSNLLTYVANDKAWYCLFGHSMATTMASQIPAGKVEKVRSERTFGDYIRGLVVYGFKVNYPPALGCLYAALGGITMATYNLTSGGMAAYPANTVPVSRVEAVVDFSQVNDGNGTVQNDVLQLIPVPANTLVLAVAFSVTTVSANLADFDIGDGATADGYIDGASAATVNDGASWNTTLTTGTPNTTAEAFSLGKFYTSEDTIDLKQNTNATVITGVIKVVAIMIDLNIYGRIPYRGD
jgi:hypothetical protein